MRITRRKISNVYIILFTVIVLYVIYFRDSQINVPEYDSDMTVGGYFPDSGAIVLASKLDWNDYVQQGKESARTGRGEQGEPSTLQQGTEHLKDQIWLTNGFNGLLSDQIALDRSLKDIRHQQCSGKRYNSLLPTVSVVIPFFEEHLTALQRTVVSVINRTPPKLLKEIILVDDGSSLKDDLRGALDVWIALHEPLVKVLRLPQRVGLIGARLAGAKLATADVIAVLDSHCEVMVGWLPPLLEPIVDDPHTVVCPLIDVINADTFAYYPQDNGGRGAFDWRFYYKRLPLYPQDTNKLPEPFENPVMNGGLFAINRKFFWELGGYDEGITIWGGEQYNLSFKIWMCGGRLLDAPCSRVGHIFRKGTTKRPAAKNAGDFLSVNYKRLTVAWMDEYAEAIYRRKPNLRLVDAGDVSNELEVRKRMNCKSFKWYLETVAPDLLAIYPPDEPPDFANGTIKSVADSSLCLDTANKEAGAPILYQCHGSGPQYFALTYKNTITTESAQYCLEGMTDVSLPEIKHCSRNPPLSHQWKYDVGTKQLVNKLYKNCVEAVVSSRTLTTMPCDVTNIAQQWSFTFVQPTLRG